MQSFSKEEYDKAFASGFKSVIAEKQAGILGDIAHGGKAILTGLVELPKDLMLYGSMAGLATGIGGHMLAEQLTQESPEEELNRTLESMYSSRSKELADKRWMNRVRAMRADLMANRKKMSVDEYTSKYNALIDALNERKA
jgi:hypothetical protein